jgi:surface protein
MGAMFKGCSSLKSLDLSSFNTSNVDKMINLFADCSLLESLDLFTFDTQKVYLMNSMFSGCYSLYEVKLSNSFTMDSVTNSTLMFSDYYLDIIQNGANLNDEIKNSIIELKNFIYIVIFSEESKNIKFINYNPENTENIIMLINGVSTTYTNNIMVDSGRTGIKLMIPEENKISCDELFKNIPEIKKIVFKNFDIYNSAREMFSGCSSLEILNLKSFDTSEITI